MKPYVIKVNVEAVAAYVVWADSPEDARDRVLQDGPTDHLSGVEVVDFNRDPDEWEVREE